MTTCDAGLAAVQAGDHATAEPLLAECVRSKAATLQAFLALAGVQQSRRDDPALLATALEGINRFPDEKRFYLTAGTIAGRRGDLDAAIAALTSAYRRWPEDTKVQNLLASAYAVRGSGHLDRAGNTKAAEDLAKAVRLNPGDAEAWLNLGRAQQNLLRFADALQSFLQVKEAPLLHFHRGMAQYSLGNFQAAIAEFDHEPDYPPARLIGGLSKLSLGDARAALADLEFAAAKMPDNAQAAGGCGRALLRLGRVADAESYLRRAAELEPRDPAPLNTLV
ncbi:MAG TPA: tetratricopeptide repeat protein, partial [Bryobacteraceae bacterium]|nr:tetratricopeptide repeat protein [Bryobacteraceae bacterium]